MSTGRGHFLLIMLAAVLALAVGETLLARGMKQVGATPGGTMAGLVATARNGWVWGGGGLLLLHLALYMTALRGADLSLALPLTAASYPLSALLARTFLHEPVGATRWAGILLITAGVAVVGLGDALEGR